MLATGFATVCDAGAAVIVGTRVDFAKDFGGRLFALRSAVMALEAIAGGDGFWVL